MFIAMATKTWSYVSTKEPEWMNKVLQNAPKGIYMMVPRSIEEGTNTDGRMSLSPVECDSHPGIVLSRFPMEQKRISPITL